MASKKLHILDLPSPPEDRTQHVQVRKKPVIPRVSYHSKLSSCHLPGQRPNWGPALKLPTHLGEYPVPEALREAIENGGDREVVVVDPVIEEVRQTHWVYSNIEFSMYYACSFSY